MNFAGPTVADVVGLSAETAKFLPLLAQDDPVLAAQGLHREVLGELNLPSGKIVAVDPLTLFQADDAFLQTVSIGRYPVIVYWVEDPTWGKRNAFAVLRFSQTAVQSWQLAKVASDDEAKLKPGEFFGYAVDAGTGAFLSPEALVALKRAMTKAEKEMPNYSDFYSDVLAEDFEKTSPSRMMYSPPDEPEKNVAMFASGFGDGDYPSYFGYAQDGKPVLLVTTFFVVDSNEQQKSTRKDILNKAN